VRGSLSVREGKKWTSTRPFVRFLKLVKEILPGSNVRKGAPTLRGRGLLPVAPPRDGLKGGLFERRRKRPRIFFFEKTPLREKVVDIGGGGGELLIS